MGLVMRLYMSVCVWVATFFTLVTEEREVCHGQKCMKIYDWAPFLMMLTIWMLLGFFFSLQVPLVIVSWYLSLSGEGGRKDCERKISISSCGWAGGRARGLTCCEILGAYLLLVGVDWDCVCVCAPWSSWWWWRWWYIFSNFLEQDCAKKRRMMSSSSSKATLRHKTATFFTWRCAREIFIRKRQSNIARDSVRLTARYSKQDSLTPTDFFILVGAYHLSANVTLCSWCEIERGERGRKRFIESMVNPHWVIITMMGDHDSPYLPVIHFNLQFLLKNTINYEESERGKGCDWISQSIERQGDGMSLFVSLTDQNQVTKNATSFSWNDKSHNPGTRCVCMTVSFKGFDVHSMQQAKECEAFLFFCLDHRWSRGLMCVCMIMKNGERKEVSSLPVMNGSRSERESR